MVEGGEEMSWQQFLTEKVLKECWHVFYKFHANTCKKCGKGNNIVLISNRTFDNRDDMMDLYEALYREMKWFGFRLSLLTCDDSHAFCLNGEGYEDRCKMVAKFYGWEVKK